MPRPAHWLRLGAFYTALGGMAMAARVAGYPSPLSGRVAWLLDGFLEPGLTIWWCTVGGLFEGFPSRPAGYAVTLIGNVAFWLAMSYLALRLWRRVVTRSHPPGSA